MSVFLFSRPVASQVSSAPTPDDRHQTRGAASMLAAAAGVLAAFGSFLVLAVLIGASGIAVVGMPLDLAPRDWHRLATVIALGAALVSLLAYLFGGYVAARLGGRDGLQHGLRVFALAVLVLGVLGERAHRRRAEAAQTAPDPESPPSGPGPESPPGA